MAGNQPIFSELVATGIVGLDEILRGGLPRHHLYLIEGETGTGKTTLGLQFLMEGLRQGERVLMVTLAEVAADLHEIGRSHGWTLEDLDIYELPASEVARQLDSQQTVFPTSEVELMETTQEIVDVLQEKRPHRVVFDSVTEIRLLATDAVRYRHQMLTLGRVLAELRATVLFTDRLDRNARERVMDSLVHGILRLERRVPEYGATRRRIEVTKLRGARYQEGWHDYRIRTGGLEVYPRLTALRAREQESWSRLTSGVTALDDLLGGGLEMGTSTLVAGASGTGKSSLAALFVYAAVRQQTRAAVLLFDERPATLLKRSADLNMPLDEALDEGLLHIRQFEIGELAAGEFAHYVRKLVDEMGVRVLVFDSLTGYLAAMQEENLVLNQMHDLLNYLSRRGVLSMLVVTQHGVFGEAADQGIDVSYLADTVVYTRHFEISGAVRQAVSVVKKRHGPHEKTIRELLIGGGGIRVGPPLVEFRGVLTGNPEYRGGRKHLMEASGEQAPGKNPRPIDDGGQSEPH